MKTTTILDRTESENLIKNIDWQAAFIEAWKHNSIDSNGYAAIDLSTGTLFGYSSYVSIIDTPHIVLLEIPACDSSFFEANSDEVKAFFIKNSCILHDIEDFDKFENLKYQDTTSYIYYILRKYPQEFMDIQRQIQKIMNTTNFENYNANIQRTKSSWYYTNSQITAQLNLLYD